MGAPTCGTATVGSPVGDGRVTYAAVVLVGGAVGDVLWGLAVLKDSHTGGGADPLVESVLVGPLEPWGWVVVVWSVVLAVGAALLFTSHESGRLVGVSAASLSGVAAGGRACVRAVRAGGSWGTPSPARPARPLAAGVGVVALAPWPGVALGFEEASANGD